MTTTVTAEATPLTPTAIQIEPNGVYDDDLLYALLGVSIGTLTKARKANKLRFSRQGQRVLYLGEWVLDWLRTGAASTPICASGGPRRAS
jgi:hypothetical protein